MRLDVFGGWHFPLKMTEKPVKTIITVLNLLGQKFQHSIIESIPKMIHRSGYRQSNSHNITNDVLFSQSLVQSLVNYGHLHHILKMKTFRLFSFC